MTVTVKPLFDNVDSEKDPEELRRFFFVIYPPDSRLAAQNPWDIAYRAEGSELIADAEPDLDHVLAVGTKRSGFCFEHPSDPPKAWALNMIHAGKAWEVEPRKYGKGIRICHPDTGWADHADLDHDRLELSSALDLIDGSSDGHDPLNYQGLLLHPGHGTATGSVIISGGGVQGDATTAPGEITGVAPAASLIPIRTAKSTVQVFDSDLARAVRHSTLVRGDVISMSLGGRIFFGLHAAVRDAVNNGLLVLAAAGNCVSFVVAPAVYPEVIAVAAVNERETAWKGTCSGSAVTISAPGEHVWRALREPGDNGKTTRVGTSQGTSYAVAMTAGAAALWLDSHAIPPLREKPRGSIQETFRADLRATAHVPAAWDGQKMGAGILNAYLLVKQPHPGRRPRPAPLPPAAGSLELLSRFVDSDRKTVIATVARLVGTNQEAASDFLGRFGPELMALIMMDPQTFRPVFSQSRVATSAELRVAQNRLFEDASETFRNAMRKR
jgi:Subtilase family